MINKKYKEMRYLIREAMFSNPSFFIQLVTV